MYTSHAGFPLRARYTTAQHESRRNGRAYKGGWNVRIYATIETRNAVRGRERRDKPITSRPSFPFFLTSLFEELIAASIRLCRRFGSLVFANENYRTHGARCHCLRTIYFFSYTERRISKQRGNTSVNTKACPEREKRVSTWLARALFPMYLWMCRMWHEDVFRSLNSKRKTTRGYTGVLEEVFVRVALSILDFRFGLYRDSWDRL